MNNLSIENISYFVTIAEAIKNKSEIRRDAGLKQIPRYRMDFIFFPLFLFPRCIKINLSRLEPYDMHKLVCGNIQQQRAQSDEGMAPLDGMENLVILKTDPVKIKIIRSIPVLILTIVVPA